MKFAVFSLVLFALVLSAKASEKARFDNYRVYEILIETDDQLELMQQIENYPDGYRFWDFPGEKGMKASLVVPPHKFGEFSELTEKFQLKTRQMIKNLQEVMDNEQPKKRAKAVGDWTSFWTLEEINEWMDSLVELYPNDVTHINYGLSYENRALRGVKINIGGGEKKSVVFEGTIHSREWISAATVTWMANELLTSTDPEIQTLARTYEWIVLPVVNVDGYVYTWTKDRSWRKTRRPSNLLCFGADPNRNWDNHFNEGGSSSNPCSDLYAGSAPFSEVETKQLSDYLKTIPRLTSYFAFHAFGQLLMLPYGWTKEILGNYQELFEIGEIGLEALTAKHNTKYQIGSIANIIYIAAGSSLDWVTDNIEEARVTYAYEFRDEGQYGFVLPANQIIGNAIEVFASIVAMLKEAQRREIA